MASADIMATSMHSKDVASFLEKEQESDIPIATTANASYPSSVSVIWKIHVES